MEKTRLLDLFFVTLIIDGILIYILLNDKLLEFDKGVIYLTLILHVLYISGALFEEDLLTNDLSHFSYIWVTFVCSLFITNKKLLILIIGILICMQIFWLIDDGKCPIGKMMKHERIKEWLSNNETFMTILPNFIIIYLIVKLLS